MLNLSPKRRCRTRTTPEFLVKTLQELVETSKLSIPDLSAQAARLAQIFKNGQLNSENYSALLGVTVRFDNLNDMARRVRISCPEQRQHVTFILSLLATLEANLLQEKCISSTNSRIPLTMFKHSTRKKLLDFNFMYPFNDTLYLLERLVRPELYMPIIHVIYADIEGSLREYYISPPGLTRSETRLEDVARDDPRLAYFRLEANPVFL